MRLVFLAVILAAKLMAVTILAKFAWIGDKGPRSHRRQFASAGFGSASYFRKPGYVDTSGTFSWALNVWNFKQINPECYSTSELFFGMSPWNLHFYLGGEGGDAASGKCP